MSDWTVENWLDADSPVECVEHQNDPAFEHEGVLEPVARRLLFERHGFSARRAPGVRSRFLGFVLENRQ